MVTSPPIDGAGFEHMDRSALIELAESLQALRLEALASMVDATNEMVRVCNEMKEVITDGE